MWERGIVMPYESERGRPEVAHHLILEDRERLSVSGVEEVESFDENTIVMHTSQGTLIIRGENLHIEKLSLDGGDLKVEGDVDSLTYEDGRGEVRRLLRPPVPLRWRSGYRSRPSFCWERWAWGRRQG